MRKAPSGWLTNNETLCYTSERFTRIRQVAVPVWFTNSFGFASVVKATFDEFILR